MAALRAPRVSFSLVESGFRHANGVSTTIQSLIGHVRFVKVVELLGMTRKEDRKVRTFVAIRPIDVQRLFIHYDDLPAQILQVFEQLQGSSRFSRARIAAHHNQRHLEG